MRPTRFSFTYAIFCAAALCLSSGAKAQTPGSTELFNWTGFYIGGNIGGLSSNYGFGHYTDTVDVDAQFSELPAMAARDPFLNVLGGDGTSSDFGFASFSFPDTGTSFGSGSNQSFLGGGQIGYNKQFGHWVIGVEGDFQGTSASGKQLSSGFEETFSPVDGGLSRFGSDTADTTLNAERKAETDWTASLRARFGYAVGPLLFYGTAGIAWTDVKVIATETASTDFFQPSSDITAAVANPRGGGQPIGDFIGNVPNSNFSKTSDDVQMGWTGGCGSEWAINDKVSVAVEYRHSDYGSHTYHFASNEGVIFPGDTKVSLETDQVTLRFNILISHFFGH